MPRKNRTRTRKGNLRKKYSRKYRGGDDPIVAGASSPEPLPPSSSSAGGPTADPLVPAEAPALDLLRDAWEPSS